MEREKPRDPKANATSFKKGRAKTGGRKPGTQNATPKLLKDCILMAAELSGQDGEGKGGLVGLLLRMATEDLRAFAMLLGRVLPLQQIESRNDVPAEVVYRSVEEVQRELEERGIRLDVLARALQRRPSTLIEHDVAHPD